MADPKETDPQSELGRPTSRTFTLDRGAMKVDEEARTVELAFSSETPVERWFGREVLDHTPSSARMQRLNSGAPLLLCHDRNRQVGVVESARIDADRVGRAVVRFSKSASGEEIFQDVRDGIRRTVSFRYVPWKSKLDKREKGEGDTYRVSDWEPLEISLEPIPADPTVGVGRSAEGAAGGPGADTENPADAGTSAGEPTTEARKTMDKDEKDKVEQPDQAPSAVEAAREMVDFGELFGDEGRELARNHVAEGKGLDELRAAIAERRRASKPKTPAQDPRAAAERNGGGDSRVEVVPAGHLRNFRGERAQESAYRFGQFMLAALFRRSKALEYCREHGIPVTAERAQSESDNESGGILVPAEFEPVMIDLREWFGVFRRFANVVPMASNEKSRPRRKGGLKAYPIGARGASRRLTESKKNWDRGELHARKWGVLAKYETELEEDAVVSVGDDLAGEIAYAFTRTEDECGFLGDGSGDYHGITGVVNKLKGLSNTVGNIAGLVVASGNAWDEITRGDFLKLIGRLPEYADTPNARFFCSKTFWSEVMCRIALEAGGTTAAEVEGMRKKQFMGYPVEVSQVMPKTEANSQIPVLFGDLRLSTMLGDRRGMTVKLTDSNDTDFEEDLISIRGTERFDINVHDVGNADATASKREPGPVVGLITAAA